MNEVVIDQTHMNIMNWIATEDGKKERANDTNTRITHEDEASRISPAVYLDPASREDTPANEKSGIAVNSVSAEVSEEVSESRKPDHSNEEIHEADATLSDEKTWSVCWRTFSFACSGFCRGGFCLRCKVGSEPQAAFQSAGLRRSTTLRKTTPNYITTSIPTR